MEYGTKERTNDLRLLKRKTEEGYDLILQQKFSTMIKDSDNAHVRWEIEWKDVVIVDEEDLDIENEIEEYLEKAEDINKDQQ